MADRCKYCGALVNGVTICNFCSISIEERRFQKMVNREELKDAQTILVPPEIGEHSDAGALREG